MAWLLLPWLQVASFIHSIPFHPRPDLENFRFALVASSYSFLLLQSCLFEAIFIPSVLPFRWRCDGDGNWYRNPLSSHTIHVSVCFFRLLLVLSELLLLPEKVIQHFRQIKVLPEMNQPSAKQVFPTFPSFQDGNLRQCLS